MTKTRSAGSRSRMAAALASTQASSSRPRAVLHPLHLVAVVLVEDEDREEPAHVGPHGLGAAEVEPLRVRLLREDDDVVPLAAPLAASWRA